MSGKILRAGKASWVTSLLQWLRRGSALMLCAQLFAIASGVAYGQEEQSLQIGDAFLSYPDGWQEVDRLRNSVDLVKPSARQKERLDARVQITSEIRRNHAEALRRLGEIAVEEQEPVHFIVIAGWPALERRRIAPFARTGREQIEKRSEVAGDAMRVTIAVAAGETLVRLEATLAPDADDKVADEISVISRGLRPSVNGDIKRAERELVEVQGSLPRPAVPRKPPAEPKDKDAQQQSTLMTEIASAAAGAAVVVQSGFGELEIAASATGQQVVVAANSGYSNSTDGGASFTSRGLFDPGFPHDGDPSLALGRSGAFYYGFIGFPNGTPAAGGVNGCSDSLAVSSDNGATFSFRNHAVFCPFSGAGMCFPDQEHIAADPRNAGTGGDQVYFVWRHFQPTGSWTNCQTPGLNVVAGRIVCSTDGGTTWGTERLVGGGGDFPRVSVGPDGSVYVVSVLGGNVMLDKFSSCNTGLVEQVGFPVTVTSFTQVACPVSGLDRCNDGNTLASPTVAVDDLDASHVYVALASSTGSGGENVIVRDSTDGGLTFPRSVTVNNTAIAARRFMPWLCTSGGVAYVSWYDRRDATSSANDLTAYFGGSASVQGGSLVAGSELNISGVDDTQCSTWPCHPRSLADCSTCRPLPSPSCPTADPTGGCPKYGDYNGAACGAGRRYNAWSSATPPAGVTAPGPGINIYAKAISVGPAPTVTLTANPSTIAAGGSSTLTWSSTGTSSCVASGGWTGNLATSGSQSVSPAGTTVYTLTCSGTGGSANASATVTVTSGGGVPAVFITATPQSIAAGSSSSLRWASNNVTNCTASGGWSGAQPTSGSTSVFPASTTNYSLTCTGPGGSAANSVTVTVGPVGPGVSLTATPSTIQSGQSSTLAWASTGVSSCSAAGGWSGAQPTSGSTTVTPASTTTYTLNCTSSGSTMELVRNGAFSGTVTEWTIVGNFFADSQVTNCHSCPGYAYLAAPDRLLVDSNNLAGWIYQDISLPAGASSMQLSFWASISTLETSTTTQFDVLSTTIRDTANNILAVASTLSNLDAGGYRKITYNLAPSLAGQTIRIFFLGTTDSSNGTVFRVDDVSLQATLAPQVYSATATVTVVAPPPPTLSLTANPNSITAGQTSTLTWAATNASSCSASGGWSGGEPTSGSQVVTPTVTTTYSLSCSGTGGTANSSVTVAVVAPPPTVSLTANPPTILAGASSTLSWTTTNATSCTAYGGWAGQGSKPLNGSQVVSPATTTTYGLSCQGAGGTATGETTVQVTTQCTPPAAPTGVTATANGQTAINVSWNASPGATSYTVFRSTANGGPYSQVGTSGSTSFGDSGLTCHTPYFYVVTAGNGSCSSGNSVQASATTGSCPCTTPAAPTGVTAAANGTTAINLLWNASSGATSYAVSRSTTSGGPYTQVGTSSSTSFTDTGLVCNTPYFYVVTASNGSCSSGNSAQASATTAACPTCTATTLYSNDFESGSGLSDWTLGTFGAGGLPVDWRGIQACAAHGGSNVFRFGGPSCGDSYGANGFTFSVPRGSTGIAVPGGSTHTTLSFWHRYNFGNGESGGSLAISVDNAHYFYVPSSAILSGSSFNGTITSSCPPPGAAGAPVFTGTQTSFVNTVVDLDAACNAATGSASGCGGQSVYIAFIGITSCAGAGTGWSLDDVTVTACQQPAAPLSFYTLAPCRVIDTRGPAGPLGAPALQPSGLRTFVLPGACGLPVTAKAVSVNVTVTQPTSDGDLRIFPAGITAPLTSTINFRSGQTRANNAVIGLAADGSGGIVVQCDSAGSVQLILDVNGYFQ